MPATLAERLMQFNRRLLPDMVQLKYKFMAESAFRFYRGTCHLFYEDLSQAAPLPPSPVGYCCGDLHLENFGSFKGNNRMVYFDMNDFDEAMLAPLSWDVVRMLCSIFVGFDTLKIKEALADKAAGLFLSNYCRVLLAGKALYIDPRTAQGIVKRFLKTVKKRKESEFIRKITDPKSKELKIKIDHTRYFEIDPALKQELIDHMAGWLRQQQHWPDHFAVKDAVFRVAGTGSVGLKRYMFLLQSTRYKKKFALIEMKQGTTSSLAPYNTVKQPLWSSDAERTLTIKQRMQNIPPALLGPSNFQGNTYVLQEMQPMADKVDLNLLAEHHKYIRQVIEYMALLLASAQLRSGGIQGSAIIDDLMAFGRDTTWQKPLLAYAKGYAAQVKQDYKQFMDDYKQGVFDASFKEAAV